MRICSIPAPNFFYWLCAAGLLIYLSRPNLLHTDALPIASTAAAIIFRENLDHPLERFISFWGDEVPGFDHIALLANGIIYETHPGYGAGGYLEGGHSKRSIDNKSGAQWQHSLRSFLLNTRDSISSPVLSYAIVPIDSLLAQHMRAAIVSVQSYDYAFVEHSLDAWINDLTPGMQKGMHKSFTCVGLIEWAADKSVRGTILVP